MCTLQRLVGVLPNRRAQLVRRASGVRVAGDALAGRRGPPTYGDVFRRLGEREVISRELAGRLAAATGFRNLVAHQYEALDSTRVHMIASERLADLLAFCDEVARRVN